MADLVDRLRSHVAHLAGTIGPRNVTYPAKYDVARDFITRELQNCGLDALPEWYDADGHRVANVVATLPGRSERVVVVGAHYDSCLDTPGADDNASAVAALIEVARLLAGRRRRPRSTVRFVAFANEEPPYFGTRFMGSQVHTEHLRDAGTPVRGMLCLEMLGYYTDGPQPYPPEVPAVLRALLPRRGDFLALMADAASARWAYGLRLRMGLRQPGPLPRVPVYALAIPPAWTGGAHLLSDHAPFRHFNIPAVMATDTAFVRNPHYHRPTDLPATLDYPRLARVTLRLARAVGRA